MNKMRSKVWLILALPLFLGACSFGGIDTGNVGVEKSIGGQRSNTTLTPGGYFTLFASVDEYAANEIAVDWNHLTPKAKDNLKLKEMDISAYYKVVPSCIVWLENKYSNQTVKAHGIYYPMFSLVDSVGRDVIFKVASEFDSLVMHTKRDEIVNEVHNRLQAKLDEQDKGCFVITRVIVRGLLTDESIEQSIRDAVANQKKLEAKKILVDIAVKDAEIEVVKAQGTAKANAALNITLSKEFLQHEANVALLEFARSGKSNTIVMQAGMNTSMMLPIKADH
jgi:nicotinamidase-related amidase